MNRFMLKTFKLFNVKTKMWLHRYEKNLTGKTSKKHQNHCGYLDMNKF